MPYRIMSSSENCAFKRKIRPAGVDKTASFRQMPVIAKGVSHDRNRLQDRAGNPVA